MKINTCCLATLFFLVAYLRVCAQEVDNIVLITLDGLRWQELYSGAADSMMSNKELVKEMEVTKQMFGGETPEIRRQRLLPFFWDTIAQKGQLYGNRWLGNKVNCTNRHRFSYPGYHEILTGYTEPTINSNAKKYNPNKTILEVLNQREEYAGKVAAFGSWDVFPYIINDVRSGVPVNAGFQKASGDDLTCMEHILNDLQDEISGPWLSVRLDAFTHNYMMEYLEKNHPRVVYIAYGETDDFAHDGRYDMYLRSALKTDKWIEELWSFLQSDTFYAGRTTLVITTDHGRGVSPMTQWKSHGTIYQGSDEIWVAAIGPNVPALGEVNARGQLYQNQIAATVMKMLGEEYAGEKYEPGLPISSMIHAYYAEDENKD